MTTKTGKNLYAKLGVSPGASPEAVGQAYYNLAKAHHPDLTAGDEAKANAFAEILAAAVILRDPERRNLYDRGFIDDDGSFIDLRRLYERRRRSRKMFRSVFALSFLVARRNLYDRGFIDDDGSFTDLRRLYERRRRSRKMFRSVFALSFLVALPLAFWPLTEIRETKQGQVAQKVAPAQSKKDNQANVKAPTSPDQAANSEKRIQLANAAPAQAPDAVPPATVGAPATGSREEASGATPSGVDRYYLPRTEIGKGLTRTPAAFAEPPAPPVAAEVLPPSKEEPGQPRDAQTLPVKSSESKGTAELNRSLVAQLSRPEVAPEDSSAAIRERVFRKQDREKSSTRTTAACLACLTQPEGNCGNICP
ncbi:MAG: J domain-containing protein [Rhodomicrobium sp.]